jgi:hypothetical protein
MLYAFPLIKSYLLKGSSKPVLSSTSVKFLGSNFLLRALTIFLFCQIDLFDGSYFHDSNKLIVEL